MQKKSTTCPNAALTACTFALAITASTASLALPDSRIVGGTVASDGQFPWQIAIFSDLSDVYQSQSCGGTLVHERWVVSAAHCFFDGDNNQTPASDVLIGAGFNDLNNAQTGQVRQAARIIVHPLYNASTFNNDIALVELATPFDLTACGERCQTIGLVTPETAASVMPASTVAIVSGWGNQQGGIDPDPPTSFSPFMEFAQLFIVDCLAGTFYSAEQITENMFCAGVPDFSKDACQGDSGGPLVVQDNSGTGNILLAGVVSWGDGCAVPNLPGVYTRVANYVDWINTSTNGDCCSTNDTGGDGGDDTGNDGDGGDDTGNNGDDTDTGGDNGDDSTDNGDSGDDTSQPTSKKKSSGSFTLLGSLGLLLLAGIRRRFLLTTRAQKD